MQWDCFAAVWYSRANPILSIFSFIVLTTKAYGIRGRQKIPRSPKSHHTKTAPLCSEIPGSAWYIHVKWFFNNICIIEMQIQHLLFVFLSERLIVAIPLILSILISLNLLSLAYHPFCLRFLRSSHVKRSMSIPVCDFFILHQSTKRNQKRFWK